MEIRRTPLLAATVIIAALACSKSTTPTPATAPTPVAPPAAAPVTPPPAGGAAPGGRAGAPGAGGRGAPMTVEQRAVRRDSIGALRSATVAQLMTSIAGKENLPAGQVFKNVQEMKDVPAGRFLVQMDSVFGRALSLNCNSCHLVTDWASDSLARKKTARTMMNVVNAINTTELAKLNRPRTPQITCVTCHRGSGNTAPGQIVP